MDGVVFEAGNWEPHLPAGAEGESWGNHRAVVVTEQTEVDAVFVTIPWRRHDPNPGAKSIVVVDAESGEPVRNALALRVENVSGDVVFQPNPNAAVYHVYYMPWASTGGHYPRISYPDLAIEPDASWARSVRSLSSTDLPRARTTHIQSVNEFHSFFPMEVIATHDETAEFMSRATDGWALVPEHRDCPVRMRHYIPQHWAERTDTDVFQSHVLRDESFAFQLVAVAGDALLDDIRVAFAGFPAEWNETLTCFNCGGTNEKGERFEKDVSVPAGAVQPLWFGLRIPEDQSSGMYEGEITVSARERGSKTVVVSLEVEDGRVANAGYEFPELQTRLAWLNSTVGTDPDHILEPFVPVSIDGHSLSILGRRVNLAASGLPDNILSYFTPELTYLADEPDPLLARPLALEVIVGGRPERFESAGYEVQQESRGRARWTAENSSGRLSMRIDGALEYDGMLDYRITLIALRDLDVDDIVLPVVLLPDGAEYMLGLGFRGGERPGRVDWKWKIENHQEGVWLGGVHKGLQYVLRDENYERPLNTNFYQNQPLHMPPSWFNGGRGGIRIQTEPDAVTALNYSGVRSLSAGDTLHFNVRFLITPFKPIDTAEQFNTRFVHQYVPVDSVTAWGGTVVNIHHANEINPYINYPFFNLEQQAAYIDEAHEKGIKFKLYNTIRELTYRAYELFALRSLGDEILNDGEGGGHSWMQEHLESDYHSAWHAWRVDDAAMLNKGTSRWTNYYIEGLSWLASNQQIDGLYLDDIAFSRETVKRLVSVLDEERDDIVIDLHSANQFNERDGHINSAMLYMEHFPYITRLWFGEYFEYDRDADYWLTEVSGLPFGLMGEMLEGGGHPYRGMLYGMTARKYGDTDPRPVWKMMNEFGIAESRMQGYWLENTPVRTDIPRILATTYVRDDRVLITLASWSENDETVRLTFDASALGMESGWRAVAPAVEGLQSAAEVDLSAVQVPANQGLFVIVRPVEAR
ncbi:MAG: hypothetical protein AMS21_08450 [Gemmatimonas sp. SG8_38_2]|nr:MAG: hypothetical protein AMS21_08450 [Gemmatimonas sp. SG8_38_2]